MTGKMENNNLYQEFNREMVKIPEQPGKKQGGTGKIIALALCCSLIGGITGAGSMYLVDSFKDRIVPDQYKLTQDSGRGGNALQGERDAKALTMSKVNTGKEMTASEVYAANVNSTVGITTSIETNYFGYRTMAAAAGSGFILSDNGYIVTNYHVVADANEIKVTTYDNKEYSAELIGYDEDKDLAVLKIEADGLTPVVLGDSDLMNVGDNVIAIGNPLGELTFSLTQGAISALNRSITIENTAMNLIQTDCAINSGNSGGPMINSYGQVVGITNAKMVTGTSEGLGFVIPINKVKTVIESIINYCKVINRPFLGLTLSLVEEGAYYGVEPGVYVTDLIDGGPAVQSGVKIGDKVLTFGGVEISVPSDIIGIRDSHKVGDKVDLVIERDGKQETIVFTIGDSGDYTDAGSVSNDQDQGEFPDQGGFPDQGEPTRPDSGNPDDSGDPRGLDIFGGTD